MRVASAGPVGHVAPAIQTLDLSVGQGDAACLTVPDLTLPGGEARLLLGPSGCGKSTLLMTLAGLLRPVRGEVVVNGVRLGSLTATGRDRLRGRRMGLVFQDIHGVPGLSIVANVLLGAFATGLSQDRVRAMSLLDRVGLAALSSRRFETLSRGEAQRVAIARALLLEPSVILADEPTASLDDVHAGLIADLLVGMARETGAALIVATHDRRWLEKIDAVIPWETAP